MMHFKFNFFVSDRHLQPERLKQKIKAKNTLFTIQKRNLNNLVHLSLTMAP